MPKPDCAACSNYGASTTLLISRSEAPRLFYSCVSSMGLKEPLILLPRPVLNRLRQMRRLDGVAARQVGSRARQLEHPVKGARRELELRHGHASQPEMRFW